MTGHLRWPISLPTCLFPKGPRASLHLGIFNTTFSEKVVWEGGPLWPSGPKTFKFSILYMISCLLGTQFLREFSSVQLLSCVTLCDPMDCSMPGFPVHHQLPEFTQTHVHRVGDAIQPSHPLLFPSLPTFNLSQHQGLFKWVGSLHQVAKVLEFQFQHQSFQWMFRLVSFRMDWVDLLAVQGTLKSSATPQFKSISSSVRMQY